MKKWGLVASFFILVNFNAFCFDSDVTLLSGFETAFGFGFSSATSIKINGSDVSSKTGAAELSKIIAPGFNIMARFDAGKEWDTFIKFRFLFLSNLYTDMRINTTDDGSTLTSHEYSCSDFERAFFIDLSGGWTYVIPLNWRAALLFDVGPAFNFTYVESDSITERIFGFGPGGSAAFNFEFGDHFRLETGLNLVILVTYGSRSEPGVDTLMFGTMIPISPYLNVGYKF